MKAEKSLERVREAEWVTDGPNSGGVGGWWLYRGHMFRWHRGFNDSEVGEGIPVAAWLIAYAARHPGIARDLAPTGGPEPTAD